MPITAITYQPNAGSLNAAYMPIVFRVKARIPNATAENYIPPVVFCDIYVEGIYYKTLSRSQFIANDGTATEYEFDVQDAIQEIMKYNLPKLNGDLIEAFTDTIKKVSVKFRNTFIDANGFNTSEQQAPVQGTPTVPPVSGGGTPSNEFYTLNSVIQHEESPNLDQLLAGYRTGTWADALPLTKRPAEYKLCNKDSSHFPIVSAVEPKQICVQAKMKNGQVIDLCAEILDFCPVISGIQYSIVKDVPNNSQIINFSWINPANLPAMPYDIKIYRKISGSNGPWTTTTVTVFPNHINSHSIIAPFGQYDFVFEIIGRCKGLDFENLPGIGSVGVNKFSPPKIVINWADNQGYEDRVCSSGTCGVLINVIAVDEDDDITNVKVLKSIDNGQTWSTFIPDLSTNQFTDSLDNVSNHKYRAIVTDAEDYTAESNTLSIKGNSVVKVNQNPDVYVTIYKADSGSNYIGQLKFYNLKVATVDNSQIVKVELFVRFRSIGLNAFWEKTETHIVSPPVSNLELSRQFPYGFKDTSKYIASRDWNGADSVNVQIRVFTASGEVKIINANYIGFPWFPSYPQAITM